MRIAVAGGTGTVGRQVVAAVAANGHRPVVLARSVGVDLLTGEGLAAALDGVDAVIDVSNRSTTSRRVSEEFFGTVTRNLLAAGATAGVRHLVPLSIVGADRAGAPYYAGKVLQEQLVRSGRLPATLLRATQFHEFAGQWIDSLRGPLLPVLRMRIQPVSTPEVAALLVEVAAGPPREGIVEIAGPRQEWFPDLVRATLRARGSRRLALPLPLPGATGRGLAGGVLLPGPGARLGRVDFAGWLADRGTALGVVA